MPDEINRNVIKLTVSTCLGNENFMRMKRWKRSGCAREPSNRALIVADKFVCVSGRAAAGSRGSNADASANCAKAEPGPPNTRSAIRR